MSRANKIIKNTGYLYLRMCITMLISLYTTRLILTSLGVSDFGIYNLVGGAIAMLGFLHTAMSSATQRFMSYYTGSGDIEKQKSIFNVSSVLHYGIAMILTIVLIIAGLVFFNGILNIPKDRIFAAKFIYASLILSTAFTVISVPYEAILNAHENMLFYAIVGILESILKLTVALSINYYLGDKLILYGVLMAIVPFISRTIMQVYCHRKYIECVIALRTYWDKSLMKEMASFAGWSFFGSMVSIIANYGQGIVLNIFFGTVLNATHGIATQINGQISFFSNSLMKALNPVIVKNESIGNKEIILKTIYSGSKISFLLLAIFTIPIIIEMPFILKVWIIDVPEYTIIFCRLLLIISLIDQLFITLPTAISATGTIKKYQVSVSLLLLLPLIASIVLFKYGFPPYTIYIAFIIQRIIRTFGVVLYFSNKILGISRKDYIKNVIVKSLLVAGITLIVGIISERMLIEGYMRLLSTFIATFTTFLICTLLFGLTNFERLQVFSLISFYKRQIFRS